MLQRVGYRGTGQRRPRRPGLHRATRAPAVVLLDVMLPHVDGLQLVALLRKQPAWASVPVLMLTAKAQEHDVSRALDAGATDYIVKPFQPEDLLARVRSHAPLP
ncbi:response regulator transcription factor [Ramlibacter terrae]|uniref:Response regulator transcription factor n=1 Tax=Ramlibacter terrae TaxID=2732511 RepID=A0ABX6P2J0_9BURK|nr:response regulator transcription factor [Ramlibacter terrae]